MGNVTVSVDSGRKLWGNKRIRTGTITMSSSYATSGDSIPAVNQTFGLGKLERLMLMGVGVAGYGLVPDSSTAPTKILAYNGTTQVTATTSLSTVVIPFVAIGR